MDTTDAIESTLENALGQAFGGAEAEKEAPNPAAEVAQEEQVEEQQLEAEAEPEAPVDEPSFEIEVDGTKEVVTGAEKIRELLQKGMHYGRNSEVNARTREQLAAQAQQQNLVLKFQNEVMGDIAELQALNQQLSQWDKIDLAAEFEKDMFQAMRMKEQRDQLRERRNAKQQQLQLKADNFKQGQAEAARQLAAAEMNVLLAKLPEWRNSEKAQAEREQLKAFLAGHGYSGPEIDNVTDHRFVLLARDAYRYRQLQQGKSAKLNQARQAPPVVKPGTKAPPKDGKAEFTKFRQSLKRAGREGNHKAQEDAVTALFERTFR